MYFFFFFFVSQKKTFHYTYNIQYTLKSASFSSHAHSWSSFIFLLYIFLQEAASSLMHTFRTRLTPAWTILKVIWEKCATSRMSTTSTMSRWIHVSRPVMVENTTLKFLILKPVEEWMKSHNRAKTIYVHARPYIQDGVAANGHLYLLHVVMVCFSLNKA